MDFLTQAELEVVWPRPELPVYREVDHQKTALVPFRLEMEFRSWGLKSVEVFPFGSVTIPLFVKDFVGGDDRGAEREVVLSVDLAKCKVAYDSSDDGGGRVTVTELRIELLPDWTPDYSRCEIVVVR